LSSAGHSADPVAGDDEFVWAMNCSEKPAMRDRFAPTGSLAMTASIQYHLVPPAVALHPLQTPQRRSTDKE
jgi:hypothetical protein